MKSLIFILSFGFCFSIDALPGDTSKLVKVKYFNTIVPFTITCPHVGDCWPQWDQGEFVKTFKYDSIIANSELNKIDSVLKLSKAFRVALRDTNIPTYYTNVKVNRVIVFTYQNKKIFYNDNGNWEYDRRFLTRLFNKKNVLLVKEKKKKNKYVWINGVMVKNDRKLKAAIGIIKQHLNCGWCVL